MPSAQRKKLQILKSGCAFWYLFPILYKTRWQPAYMRNHLAHPRQRRGNFRETGENFVRNTFDIVAPQRKEVPMGYGIHSDLHEQFDEAFKAVQ